MEFAIVLWDLVGGSGGGWWMDVWRLMELELVVERSASRNLKICLGVYYL